MFTQEIQIGRIMKDSGNSRLLKLFKNSKESMFLMLIPLAYLLNMIDYVTQVLEVNIILNYWLRKGTRRHF
jgi:hypothetical protein